VLLISGLLTWYYPLCNRTTDKLWKWIGYYSIISCGIGHWLHLIGYSKTYYPMILRSIGYSIMKIWISCLITFYHCYLLVRPNVPVFCLHSGLSHIKHRPEYLIKVLRFLADFYYLELLCFKSSFVPYNVNTTPYCFQRVYCYRLFA
jgi:hypothetical protein